MAGESAQRRFERLRQSRIERVRGSRSRIVLLVAVAFVVGWLVPIIFTSVAMSMVESVAAGGEPVVRMHLPPVVLPMTTAFLFALSAAVTLLAPSRTELAWGKGAHGERIVGAALDEVSAELPVSVLHDRRMPRSRANIDHVAVSPAGVFTIDAKHYAGRLEVRGRGRELWIAGRNRSKLLEQAFRQTDVVRQALSAAGLDGVPVTPVLCFVGTQVSRLFPPNQAAGVLLTSPRKLGAILTEGEDPIGVELRSRITEVLERALPPADTGGQASQQAATQATTPGTSAAAVPPREDDRSTPSHPACGRCGDPMVVRQRRSDGARFLGCSAFPRCRNTLPLTDPVT
jgi:hypothetical protein